MTRHVVGLALVFFNVSLAAAAPPALPTEVLVVPGVSIGGRSPVPVDAVALSLASPEWKAPKAGDKLRLPDGSERAWVAFPIKDGTIGIPPGGYAYMAVKAEKASVAVLDAKGHSMVYVNGEPRVGDVYGNGIVRLPVALREGVNHFIFSSGRGPVKVAFLEPKAAAELDAGDTTLPDLRVGDAAAFPAALMVRNCTTEPATDLVIEATIGEAKPTRTVVPSLLPASARKVAFRLEAPAPEAAGEVPLKLRLLREGKAEPLHTLDLKLQVAKPEATHRRTFISDIDGSVQYFSLVPAKPLPDGKKPGLALTLHGASVEAAGQAACYAPKLGLHVVAATNRRPFGFDWEDWGRLDAIEVLDHAKRTLATDPRRTYLTGHSMGGHGTWHIGVTFPDRFAAIAPSAGWVSMWSYAGMRRDPNAGAERELVLRAANASDTLALVRNLVPTGVYVLHGDADDNVPVDQARTMRKVLAEFHGDFTYYERPNAGHWWGNECVDWQPIFEFFSRHELPEQKAVRHVAFTTANPRVTADCHWLRIETQSRAFLFSKGDITCDPEKRIFKGSTENIARLSLGLDALTPDKPFRIEIDGQSLAEIPWPKGEARVWLARDGDNWAVVAKPAADVKGPHRNGAFKDAFRNRVVFVYGTKGSEAENAWALAKARYDAEVFWYRGNGSIDVIADTKFDPKAEPNRNVILYGHASMNAAWKPLLGDSPLEVLPGSVKVGDRQSKGDAMGVLLVRPRPGSDTAMVAAVAGTGLSGMRAAERLPYFASGVGYPDWLVFDAKGVVGAGHFGNDWKLASGESAWRKE